MMRPRVWELCVNPSSPGARPHAACLPNEGYHNPENSTTQIPFGLRAPKYHHLLPQKKMNGSNQCSGDPPVLAGVRLLEGLDGQGPYSCHSESREWYKWGMFSLWQGEGIKKTSHSQFSTVHSHEALASTWEGGEAFPAMRVGWHCVAQSPLWRATRLVTRGGLGTRHLPDGPPPPASKSEK